MNAVSNVWQIKHQNEVLNISVDMESISPEKAEIYLDRNKENRPLTESKVISYIREIKAGQWIFTGEPISFNQDGNLINGQHRLNAIIKTGATLQVLVVRGLPREAFKAMDQGKKRSTADVIAITQGSPERSIAYSAIARRLLFRSNVWTGIINLSLHAGSFDSKAFSEQDQAAFNMANRQAIIRGAAFYYEHAAILRRKKLGSCGTIGALYTVLSAIEECSNGRFKPGTAHQFMESVATGVCLDAEHPAYVLREVLIPGVNDITSGGDIRDVLITRCYIYAWNKLCAGQGLRIKGFNRNHIDKVKNFNGIEETADYFDFRCVMEKAALDEDMPSEK